MAGLCCQTHLGHVQSLQTGLLQNLAALLLLPQQREPADQNLWHGDCLSYVMSMIQDLWHGDCLSYVMLMIHDAVLCVTAKLTCS